MEMMRRADESYRFLFVVNGRPFYAKGACWLTSDDLLALTPEREAWLVEAARVSHINLFRLNGGCNLFETEQFYNLCDEKGILVWQELPLCWYTEPPGEPQCLARPTDANDVLRLRQHPSLAVYVGGNEFQPYLDGDFAGCWVWPERSSRPTTIARSAWHRLAAEHITPTADEYRGLFSFDRSL